MRENIENTAVDTYEKIFEKCVGCVNFPLCIIPLEACTLRQDESFQGQYLAAHSNAHKCL